jgi:hypothetical protein
MPMFFKPGRMIRRKVLGPGVILKVVKPKGKKR